MFKRREDSKPATVTPRPSAPRESRPRAFEPTPSPNRTSSRVGPTIRINGELSGDEDLVMEGQFEGSVRLPEGRLTFGPDSRIKAKVDARTVVIRGRLQGNVTATEKVELDRTARVTGDLVAPRMAIADGAVLKGSIEMSDKPQFNAGATQPAAATQPVSAQTTASDGS